ncbi:MAG: NAD(P)-dependent oxidoreductase [Gammaproteobacteria bacterium]|nr:NAD(P)-dependent oxidoreductase [Gammaproteobacteria bacterium]
MARLAFIGLGVMGFPMAGHLARAGHTVTVYNRTAATRERWLARHPGQGAESPAAAAETADVVFSCVGNDDDLRAVTIGPSGCFGTLRPGAVHVDHSTTSALVARELASRARAQRAGFVDAPVSGGQRGAEEGTLTCMCGGDAADYAKIEPLLAAYAASARLLGPSGAGQQTKMVNQICCAGLLQGLAEALAFGQQAGLDMPAVLAVIGKGAAQSWQMDNRAATMLEGRYDFGFAVDWMRKDLGIVLDEARRNGARLPVTAVVDQFYAALQARGMQRADTSSLMALLTES